ncbi:dTDP-4-dehydrorhamnose 3,5-epimerase [Sphingomonas panacisoli]|uniref:dTDP-4-dehydrorhamnose 3,5-epimerase n=1 Tax=Sphingomonas panacisoli TaxID=1813879 RepID=A0A5B8LH47_9SPHN|nr:dTDP-4-dehydrorhamnose 3,5-epimerase [Sphingomonas panacisoli]QDZ06934.1 dTDP-4-dehydrorhamnose 3,5-epimerase [Sphingomonas panacisoli]
MPNVSLLHPRRFSDSRGWFAEVYSEPAFEKLGIVCHFVQDNHALSISPFTLRGLHFQTPPHAQAKLVRCVRGRIFDVAVDVRRNSPSFGQWVGAELSADNGDQLFVPAGFAHGYLTLESNCEVAYKCSAVYAPEHDGGIRWDDPTIGVVWPLPKGIRPQLSAKDEAQPLIADFVSSFDYDGHPLTSLS